MFFTALLPALLSLRGLVANPIDSDVSLARRAGNPATVNFANNTGTPQHLGSGILFGIPTFGNNNQIPSSMYTDIGFNFNRGGACGQPSPNRGWRFGTTEYNNMLQEVLNEYTITTAHGGKFIAMLICMWGGTDPNDQSSYPGYNGDYTQWDAFNTQLIKDLKAHNVDMTKWLIDPHNEADGPWYWTASQGQFLESWRRTVVAFRNAFGANGVTIQGPSHSASPDAGNSWWYNFASFVKQNNVIPNTWTWHMETGGGDMLQSTAALHALLDQYGLPYNNININEYAVQSEQVPSGAAWWLSQLERVNAPGLRGNWLGYPQFYDFLANLISKPGAPNTYSPTGTNYYPVGEYQVYKYYASSMTGNRVGTMPSSDLLLDVYATVDKTARKARLLFGVRPSSTGTWYITMNNFSALGLGQSGSITIKCYRFGNQGTWGEVDAPSDCGTLAHSYSGNSLTLPVFQTDKETAFAWEFGF